jgi:DNA repair ATPase RecN
MYQLILLTFLVTNGKLEVLQNKIDTSELYDIFNTLETISGSISEMNQHKGKPDEFLETWKPLLTNIENFTVKKKLLESIEAQMNQTILEMREIHQKMFDSIGVVRTYNNEREAIYAARRELADDLEKKLRTLENPPL